jgi:heme-degrading monooxygenase HmoA
MSEHYSSGNWVVTVGREKEFIQRWIEFLEWTRATAKGLTSAELIRDSEEPRHFVSFACWESSDAMKTWRSLPDFAGRLGAVRLLCEDFRGSTFTVVAAL